MFDGHYPLCKHVKLKGGIMPKGNPFNVQCPNCHSYEVQFFPMYGNLFDVLFVGFITVGIGLLIMLPAYIGTQITKNNPSKKYTCNNCSYEWRVQQTLYSPQNPTQNVLRIVSAFVFLLWITGFMFHIAGGFIHLLLLMAIISLVVSYFK